jgi:sugar phosphate permease
MTSGAIITIGFVMAKELFPVQMAGTSTGLTNLFPFAGGAVFQPLLGHVLERQGLISGAFTLAGYKEAFFLLFLCGVFGFVATLFLRETLPGKEQSGVSTMAKRRPV